VAEVDAGDLPVGAREVELDGPGRPAGAAADLGQAVLETVRQVDPGPVTGLRIGSPRDSTTPGTTRRARRPSTSTSRSIGAKSGSSLVGHMAAKTHHMVAAGSVSSPVMIFTSASRCLPSARSSTTSRIVPSPSCTAPGQA
jgi:hypothetical protein